MNRKSFIAALTIVLFIATPFSAEAQLFGIFKKKKKPQTEKKEEETVSKSNYEKILTDKKCETKSSNFISLHKTDGKIYFELPVENLNKDILIAATISSVSNPKLGTTGLKNSAPLHIRFVQSDSSVVMKVINTNFIQDKQNSSFSRSIKLNYSDISLYSFKINGYNKDSTNILFDVSSFFLKENKYFPVVGETIGQYKINSSPKEELSIISEIKAFENNICVKTNKSYLINIVSPDGKPTIENHPATFQSTYTLMKLPKTPMVPRISDTRIGVFQTPKITISPKDNQINTINFVKRWRIEPLDTTAFLAGELSTPKKPIIFYIDSVFPDMWKEPIKKGVLRWNKAFEKIGFKDVLQVKDFPKNDPFFDPDNLAYSCIRYVPTPEENAMGPSWIDPRTGEIINASVFVYNNIVKIISNWRFIQTAQIDSRVRTKFLPDELIKESLEYVVAHEIGHTLGFMHNMAASSAYPVDSLRSPSFTAKYGTTPSIMDYARYNYIAQPQDKGVSLSPPFLGEYDYFLVEWTYKVFPDLNNNFRDEAKELCNLIDSYANNPRYRYVMQQINSEKRFDPSAIEEDLGDDAVKASNYGFKNLNYIISQIDTWIEDDEDSKRKIEIYKASAMQAYQYVSNVFMNVGGIYLNQSSEKSGIPRYQVVPKEKQRESVFWLLKKARDFETNKNKKLEKKLYAGDKPFDYLKSHVQKMAIGGLQRVTLAFYLDSTSYSPLQYCEDIHHNIFEKTIKGIENLTDAEMSLQKNYVMYLKPFAAPVASFGLNSINISQTATPLEYIVSMLDLSNHFTCSHKMNNLDCLDKRVPFSAFASKKRVLPSKPISFGEGYGIPADIWLQSVNKSADYLFYYSEQTIKLLEKVSQRTKNRRLKLHYDFLLNQLKKARDK